MNPKTLYTARVPLLRVRRLLPAAALCLLAGLAAASAGAKDIVAPARGAVVGTNKADRIAAEGGAANTIRCKAGRDVVTADPGDKVAADCEVVSLRVSSDPYRNASSQHQAQVEPDSFGFGSTEVTTFQSGRFNDGGASNIGWATTTDAGKTWKSGFLPGLTQFSAPPGPYPRASDPVTTYDAQARDLDDRQPRLLPDVERDADQPLARRTGLGPAGHRVALRAGSRLRQAVDRMRQLGDESVLRELLSHLGRLRDEQARHPDVARRRAHVERAGHVSRLRQRLPERHPARRPSRRQPVRPLLRPADPAGDHLHRRRSDVHARDHDPPAGLPRRPAHSQLALPLGRGRRGRDDLRGMERLRAPAQLQRRRRRLHLLQGRARLVAGQASPDGWNRAQAHVLHAGARAPTRRERGTSGSRTTSSRPACAGSARRTSARRTAARPGASRSGWRPVR